MKIFEFLRIDSAVHWRWDVQARAETPSHGLRRHVELARELSRRSSFPDYTGMISRKYPVLLRKRRSHHCAPGTQPATSSWKETILLRCSFSSHNSILTKKQNSENYHYRISRQFQHSYKYFNFQSSCSCRLHHSYAILSFNPPSRFMKRTELKDRKPKCTIRAPRFSPGFSSKWSAAAI